MMILSQTHSDLEDVAGSAEELVPNSSRTCLNSLATDHFCLDSSLRTDCFYPFFLKKIIKKKVSKILL